ncbi:hypothetical protein K458DRAFT_385370 [Lentithecium fluviatile CBS 122367]|uniref:Uncharacterized protein n=1 Tax=Lentithecium fluviatile CBS 122367 TaxID=1168545 RepID=A0A6G1JBK3_9PLEO|nr:hypothetical protein K458DRAFT_385370 [Lentithecium fluviatile CBS 122367]
MTILAQFGVAVRLIGLGPNVPRSSRGAYRIRAVAHNLVMLATMPVSGQACGLYEEFQKVEGTLTRRVWQLQRGAWPARPKRMRKWTDFVELDRARPFLGRDPGSETPARNGSRRRRDHRGPVSCYTERTAGRPLPNGADLGQLSRRNAAVIAAARGHAEIHESSPNGGVHAVAPAAGGHRRGQAETAPRDAHDAGRLAGWQPPAARPSSPECIFQSSSSLLERRAEGSPSLGCAG